VSETTRTQSPSGATYVEPSAETILQPGTKIGDLYCRTMYRPRTCCISSASAVSVPFLRKDRQCCLLTKGERAQVGCDRRSLKRSRSQKVQILANVQGDVLCQGLEASINKQRLRTDASKIENGLLMQGRSA
jgi:hypothetical protein